MGKGLLKFLIFGSFIVGTNIWFEGYHERESRTFYLKDHRNELVMPYQTDHTNLDSIGSVSGYYDTNGDKKMDTRAVFKVLRGKEITYNSEKVTYYMLGVPITSIYLESFARIKVKYDKKWKIIPGEVYTNRETNGKDLKKDNLAYRLLLRMMEPKSKKPELQVRNYHHI